MSFNPFIRRALSRLDHHFEAMPDDLPDSVRAPIQALIDLRPILSRSEKRVTFFGVIKTGKSTLLNALLRRNVLPSRTNRATGVITEITYGQEEMATVRFHSEIENGLCQEKRVPIESIASYILLDVSGPISRSREGIRAVYIHLPSDWLPKGVTLIDTPGLLDHQSLTGRTFEALENTDLAIMVLSAQKILSLAEQTAAEAINQRLNGNLVFVINRLDQVEIVEQDDIIGWATDCLAGLGNDLVGSPRIFATAAQPSLAIRQGQTERDSPEDGIFALENWLRTLFDTAVGERVILLSRMGLLSRQLIQTRNQLQNQMQTLEAAIQDEVTAAKNEQTDRLEAFHQTITLANLNLNEVELALDQLHDRFRENCQIYAEYLMASGEQWRDDQKLAVCLLKPLQAYLDQVNMNIAQAIEAIPITGPLFQIDETELDVQISAFQDMSDQVGAVVGGIVGTVIGGGIGSAIGAMGGGWLGKNVFGKNEQQQTLFFITQKATQLRPVFKDKVMTYLKGIREQINQYRQTNAPAIPVSAKQIKLQDRLRSCEPWLAWLADYQDLMQTIKDKLAEPSFDETNS